MYLNPDTDNKGYPRGSTRKNVVPSQAIAYNASKNLYTCILNICVRRGMIPNKNQAKDSC